MTTSNNSKSRSVELKTDVLKGLDRRYTAIQILCDPKNFKSISLVGDELIAIEEETGQASFIGCRKDGLFKAFRSKRPEIKTLHIYSPWAGGVLYSYSMMDGAVKSKCFNPHYFGSK